MINVYIVYLPLHGNRALCYLPILGTNKIISLMRY